MVLDYKHISQKLLQWAQAVVPLIMTGPWAVLTGPQSGCSFTYMGEATQDEIATSSLNSWTIFLMKHIQLCFLWCTERAEQSANKKQWKSPYSQLFIMQCCSACAVRVTEQSSRKSAVKNKMPAWSSDGFQCSLCSYFCPCKYSVFNSSTTELILTDEHEAREAGMELNDMQLLCLVAAFLAKGFLEWL